MPREVKWSSPEFHHHEKDVSWYWLSGIAAIIIIGLAVWQGNFLFAIFILLAESLIIFWGRQIPRRLDFKLDENGLDIDHKKTYSYGDFAGFALKDDELIFKHKAKVQPYLKIIIDKSEKSKIKEILGHFLPEIEYEESLMDHIVKILRF